MLGCNLDLPRGAEWMIRGAYTPSLRVQIAPFGRCCKALIAGLKRNSMVIVSPYFRGVYLRGDRLTSRDVKGLLRR